MESKPQNYRPGDISEFKVADDVYKSAVVQVETSPFRINELSDVADFQLETDTVFVRILIDGEKSLAVVMKEDEKANYYIWTDGKFDLLLHKKYVRVVDGRRLLAAKDTYIAQLKKYLEDCPEVTLVKAAPRYDKSLVNHFLSYYQCMNYQTTFKQKEEKTKLESGAILGMSQASLKFRGNTSFSFLRNASFKPSNDIAAGVWLNGVLPRNRGKLSILNELLFTHYKIKGSYTDYTTTTSYTVWETTFDFYYIKLNNMVKYKLLVGKYPVHICAGISNGVVLKGSNHYKATHEYFGPKSVREGDALDKIRKHEVGAVLGAGAGFGRFSLDLRYEKSTGLSNHPYLSSSTRRYYLLLGYRF